MKKIFLTFLKVGKCYSLRHDDVVTLAFSRKITNTLLLLKEKEACEGYGEVQVPTKSQAEPKTKLLAV